MVISNSFVADIKLKNVTFVLKMVVKFPVI